MKILLICYYFAPQNVIGAIRPTKFAKYLSKMGHEVTVLCGTGFSELIDPLLNRDLESIPNVHIIKETNLLSKYRNYKKSKTTTQSHGTKTETFQANTRTGLKHKIMDSFYVFLRNSAENSFKHKALAMLDTLPKDYDFIFSTFGPLCVHDIALKAKEKKIAPYWWADFRDFLTDDINMSEKTRTNALTKVAKYADKQSGVTKGIADTLYGKGEWLPNGFDLEDKLQFKDNVTNATPPYRFVYTGQFANREKALSSLFTAISILIKEKFITLSDIELIYAGTQGSVFFEYAKDCGLESAVKLMGLVSRDQSIKLQTNTDFLLMISKNTEIAKGLFPGKLLEFFMADKPILCSITGNIPNSEIKSLLSKTKNGFCFEEATWENDMPLLVDYLKNAITALREKRAVCPDKDIEFIQQFNYCNLSKRLANEMESIIAEGKKG